MSTTESTFIERDVGTTDLVPSVSIENMVRMRGAAVERIERAVALVREANELAEAAHLGRADVQLHIRDGQHTSFADPDVIAQAHREVDAAAWQYLLHESGLRTFMDAAARKQWDEQIHKGQIPPLTVEHVTATFEVLQGSRGDMFDRGVIECFRQLSWDYKTNQPFKFGKRIILEYLFHTYGTGPKRWLTLNHGQTDRLDDLVRVMSVLAGVREPDHRQGMWSALCVAEREGKREWEGEYFSVRWFLKGTGHVAFKRMDLVDRMNDILAKHYPRALDAPRA